MNIGPVELVLILIVGALLIWPMWRILDKAGFTPALALIALIPFGFVVLYLVLAFVPWPSQKQPGA